MSGVYAKDRKPTTFDPIITAAKLQDAVTIYVMNEKYVPKRWRLIVGVDLIQKVDELNDNVIAANTIDATDETTLERRKELQLRATANCYQIDRKLQRMARAIPTATPSSMHDILEHLTNEVDYLRDWRKHDKIRQPGKKEPAKK